MTVAGPSTGTLAVEARTLGSAPDPVDLFAAAFAGGLEPVLWLQPIDDFVMVGIGRAWSVGAEGPDRFRAIAEAWAGRLAGAQMGGDAQPRLIGGLGFTGELPGSAPWLPFGAASMVLPELLLVGDRGTTTLTTSFVDEGFPDGQRRLERQWSELVATAAASAGNEGEPPIEAPAPLSVVGEHPNRATWDRLVDRFAGAVGRGRLDKVVLARRVDLESTQAMDIVGAIRWLAARSPNSTTYAVARGGSVFFGATPERLVATQNKAFQTVAIAGTIRHDEDASLEAALAAELLASDKDREEHEIVVDSLLALLETVSTEMSVSPAPVVARFGTVQHLVTTVSGRLRDRDGILSLAALLHPTPAVGGEPRDLALELIADNEGFDRGWYAGPLGWVGADGDGEFVVALRCAVVSGRSAALFAGCGIVADSDAAREWEESRNKMQVVAAALGEVRS
jgi:salicylate biosynthesis isochorismate synthase